MFRTSFAFHWLFERTPQIGQRLGMERVGGGWFIAFEMIYQFYPCIYVYNCLYTYIYILYIYICPCTLERDLNRVFLSVVMD